MPSTDQMYWVHGKLCKHGKNNFTVTSKGIWKMYNKWGDWKEIKTTCPETKNSFPVLIKV